MNLLSDLRGAVSRGEIVALFQPQVDISDFEIVAVEALARWEHPHFGTVTPGMFIPLAEANGMIGEIGDFMVDEGVRCAAGWNALGFDIEVAVNVSAAQLTGTRFIDRLENNLSHAELSADRIVIEITESLPVADVAAVTARLNSLRERGLGISIDDFGTGYSSLVELAGIPANEMKIDKSFIQDPASARGILRHIVEEAREQGQRVVAEGIETEEHLATAEALGCDRAQGYLFGRPMPEKQITEILQDHAAIAI